MPQIGRYPDNMNIDQVMNMVLAVRKEDKIKDDLLFYSFELNNMKKKSMRSLSGGTVQKVSAVLAFMFNPDVLILDEPTAGLDPLSSEILRNKIIEERERGKLVLITSHILSELDDLVTQIVFMHEGQILFHRNVNELLENTGERRISAAISHFLKRQSSD
jgi:Cu-processing system ATP-binding protein